MNLKRQFVLFVSILLALTASGKDGKRCQNYLNSKKYSVCQCIKIDDADSRIACIEKEQDAQEEYVRNIHIEYGWHKAEIMKLHNSYVKWLDAEKAYIETLEYENKEEERARKIIYRQNLLQHGQSIFENSGMLIGGGYGKYIDKIKEFSEEETFNGKSFQEKGTGSLDDGQIELIRLGLHAVMDTLALSQRGDEKLFEEAQNAWKDLYINNYKKYEIDKKGGKELDPKSLDYNVFVLKELLYRINCLSFYISGDFDFMHNSINNISTVYEDFYNDILGR